MTDNEPDIVVRLRRGVDESIRCDCVKCEAADEIEQLRKERDEARKQLSECAMNMIARLDEEMGR